MSERQWSVGELAAATGLTVRTLHHYEQVGLLTASARTAAGHRRYSDADVRRLYRIRALRSLGLSLDSVRSAIDADGSPGGGLAELLRRQLAAVDEQLAAAARCGRGSSASSPPSRPAAHRPRTCWRRSKG